MLTDVFVPEFNLQLFFFNVKDDLIDYFSHITNFANAGLTNFANAGLVVKALSKRVYFWVCIFLKLQPENLPDSLKSCIFGYKVFPF